MFKCTQKTMFLPFHWLIEALYQIKPEPHFCFCLYPVPMLCDLYAAYQRFISTVACRVIILLYFIHDLQLFPAYYYFQEILRWLWH
jgi:hypothetical protein